MLGCRNEFVAAVGVQGNDRAALRLPQCQRQPFVAQFQPLFTRRRHGSKASRPRLPTAGKTSADKISAGLCMNVVALEESVLWYP